ncbi:YciI family protein [Microbacterium ulmi]
MFVVADPAAEPYDHEQDTIGQWVDEMTERGISITGERLRPVDDATTVRIRGGELLVSDGPYIEAKEWVAGFDILECRDLDEAIEVASKHPMARFGTLELRPFWPLQLDDAGRPVDDVRPEEDRA